MRVLLISHQGDGLDLALRLKREGNSVRVFIADKEEQNLFDGLVEKVKHWQPSLAWADYVIFDDNNMENIKQQVWLSKKPAFGTGHSKTSSYWDKTLVRAWNLADILEKERKLAHQLMRELKIGKAFDTVEFKKIDEAISYLKTHEGPYVVKPESNRPIDSGLTLLGELPDNADTIAYLATMPYRAQGRLIAKVELEKRVPGIEVAVSAWFNGKDFVGPPCVNFEHKRIATGDKSHPDGLGYLCGEAGTAIYYAPDDNFKLFQETVGKMAEFLSLYDYRGAIDINTITNESGIYPLEFTPRLGWPITHIMTELHKTPWGNLLQAIASGRAIELDARPGWAIGVVSFGEGFPSCEEGKKRMAFLPVIGYGKDNQDHVHLSDAALAGKQPVATGSYVYVCTARGETPAEAQKEVYEEIIPSIYCPKTFYRTDIGDRVLNDHKKLVEWGYL